MSSGGSVPKRQKCEAAEAMPSQLTMVYFPVRARAEASRMLMAYGGLDWKEQSVKSYFGMSWGEGAMNEEKCVLGQVPILDVDGKIIGQSGSIVRYLARLTGCVPADPLAAAECDAIFEVAQDLASVNPIVNVYSGEKYEQLKKDYFETTLPRRLGKLVRILGDKPFFLGDEPYYCDFGVYHQLDLTRLLEPEIFKEMPTIPAWMARVEAVDGVKEYLDSRPACTGIGTNPALSPLPEFYK